MRLSVTIRGSHVVGDTMNHRLFGLLEKLGMVALWVLMSGAISSVHAQSFGFTPVQAPSEPAGKYERVTVHGKSLEGNLAGDSADRHVSVYLPPSYAKEPKRRYPVLYLLHGFTDSDARWFGQSDPHFVNVQAAVDAAYANGVKEMIIVMPDAFTRYQGSMYSNSAVNGDWETFIAHDLVKYMDGHYRTLPKRESRGLAGHSMGGYGTLRVGMKHPDVFANLYAMSPCCLWPTAAADPATVAAAAKITTPQELDKADFMVKATLASSAAWSPNPANAPTYLDLPLVDGKPNGDVLVRWSANAPLIMLHQYVGNLKSLHALAFDAGSQDQIPGIYQSVLELDRLLQGYGVTHELAVYEGDHVSRIHARLQAIVLPFFSKQLQF